MNNNIFEKAEKLFKGILFKEIVFFPTFKYYKSYFKEPWWNWIMPTDLAENLDQPSLNKLLKTETMLNRQICFYINQNQQTDYHKYLHQNKYVESGNDIYMHLNLTKKFEVESEGIEELNESNMLDQILLANECFADGYNNGKEYTELFEYNHKKNIKDKHFHNLLFCRNNIPVAFGFLIVDKKDNLAYLHNAGTHPNHRRKGYFEKLVKYRCNLTFEHGVNNVFAIVEKDSPSYHNYLKLGFEERDNFYLFTRDRN